MLNKCTLIGNLGGEVEVRYTQGGDAVASFSLATSEKWKNKQGERQEKTTWHNIVIWGKLAEVAAEYLHKGSKVYVEGKIDYQKVEKDGQEPKYYTKIIVHEMKMLDGKAKAEGGQDAGYQPAPGSEDDIGF